MAVLENPSDLDTLVEVKRFFIFGTNAISDRLQMLLCGRFPMRFFGFIYNKKTEERDQSSQFSLRFWRSILEQLGEGDFVFLVWRHPDIENALLQRGVRVGLAENLVSIYGTFETPTFLNFCKKYLNKSHIAIDVGGNTGLTGAIIANFAKHVTIFEPNAELISVIQTTCQGHKNITIEQKAVFNQSGKTYIYPAGVNNTTMVPSCLDNAIEVDSVTIDEYCRDKNLKPDFIKIDVEGVDAEVIIGAEKTVLNYKPLLFLEHPRFNEDTYRVDKDRVSEAMFMLEKNYDLFAYPTLDEFFAYNSDQNSVFVKRAELFLPAIKADAIGMPLTEFEKNYGMLPTNIGAVPK